MKVLEIAILAFFILIQVKCEETLETISEPPLNGVNGTLEDESSVQEQNTTETKPQQCKQNLKDYFFQLMNEYFNETTPRIEENVLEATRTMLETEFLPAIQNETVSRMEDFETLVLKLGEKVDSLESQLTSIVTQNNQKDAEIQNLKSKMSALEANQDTSKVIFSGIRKSHISSNSDITFDETIANVGQGLDPETGIFKCPVSGLYSFSFSALTDKSGTYTHVNVYKNGAFKYYIHEHDIDHKSYVNLSHVWTMVLQKDDTVQLKLSSGKGLYSRSDIPVWFNGQLMLQQ